ncbi:hypothetical protein PanWU01x14_068360 [Parasponia andersonii]|uniref:Transmembrane protein n=1 Tax=Parasponia andersonii TaxID=3476 RepID=A0A2P5DFD0_PARAD|nr:hypothetical protein PanWU01x14_068360 [Parasponia andersonii]
MMMKPNPKTPNIVIMMMMVVVVVVVVRMMIIMLMLVKRSLLINDSLNGSELIHVARNGDRALLIESVLFLGFLEKLHEERVVDVDNRNNEPLSLFLSLSNHHGQTPLWDIFHDHFFVLLMMMMEMNVRNVKVEVHVLLLIVFF